MARIIINHAVIDEFRRSPQVFAQLRVKAERVRKAAQTSAPDHPPIGQGYKQSFDIASGVVKGAATVRVYNTDFKAGWVEFGAHAGGATPVLGYRTLGKALETIRQ